MAYHVRVRQTGYDRQDGTVSSYVVSDQPENYPEPDWEGYPKRWPFIVEFPVTHRHDQESQRRRAYEYMDYLNKNIVVVPPIGG